MLDRIGHWLRGRSLKYEELAAAYERRVSELERKDTELEAMRRESGDALVEAYMERSGEMLGTLNRALEDDREGRMDFLNLERTLVGASYRMREYRSKRKTEEKMREMENEKIFQGVG